MSHTGTKLPPAKHLGYFLHVLHVLIILQQKLALILPMMNPPSFSLTDIFWVSKGSGPAGQLSRLPADPLQIAGSEINIEIGQVGENGMSLRLILGTSRCQDFTI